MQPVHIHPPRRLNLHRVHGARPNSFAKRSRVSRNFRHTPATHQDSRVFRIWYSYVCPWIGSELAQTIGSNDWLEIRKLAFPRTQFRKSQNFFADKILEMLSSWKFNRNNSHALSGSAHCLSARKWFGLLYISVSPSPSHPFLIRHDTHRFTHYRRYYRLCCAYPHAWLKPVAVNLSFVFFCSVYYAPPLHHTIEASLRRGVRGVDALRILQTGTMDREW